MIRTEASFLSYNFCVHTISVESNVHSDMYGRYTLTRLYGNPTIVSAKMLFNLLFGLESVV